MTGFASVQLASALDADGAVVACAPRMGLEIRSVNSRFLDLSFRLPDELRSVEPALRERLTARLKRGKVEVRAVLDTGTAGLVAEPSSRLLQRLNRLQDSVRAWLPQAPVLSVADVLRLANVEAQPSAVSAPEVLALADEALAALLEARAREGERLVQSLLERIAGLRRLAQ